MSRGVDFTAAGLLALSLVGAVGAGEARFELHDIEDLLASGFSSSTIEAVVREAPWAVVLSEADLSRLRAAGLSDGALALLRERSVGRERTTVDGGPNSAATVVEVQPGYGYATSGLGPCLCGNDPLCVQYCLDLSSGNRRFRGSPFAFGWVTGHHHHPGDDHHVGHGSADHAHGGNHFGDHGHRGGHGHH